MDTKALLKKVRKIEIKTRRLSDNIFGGEYQSTFKGRGMTFSEVRQYQYCLLYTSPSPRDDGVSRMPSSA